MLFLGLSNALKAADASPTNSTTASVGSGTNQLNVLDDTYRLAIGDTLSFRIIEDEDDPKILIVTDSGDLEVPYIGRYPAVGKTCKQLAQQLKVELEKVNIIFAPLLSSPSIQNPKAGAKYTSSAPSAIPDRWIFPAMRR